MTVQTGKFIMALRSGVELEVAALSLVVRNQLQVTAFQAIPLPDPKLFERVVEGVSYAGDDKPAVIPANEDPEYLELVRETRQKQVQWVTEKAVNICVDCADKDALIEAYAPNLAALRTIMSDAPQDDWTAILKCFLTTQEEYAAMMQAISQSLPITAEEITARYPYFRLQLWGDDVSGADRQQVAPDASAENTTKRQRATK